MTEPTALSYLLKELFPKASAELLRLLEGAAENAGLLRGDFFTLRDWLEVADYCDADGLLVLMLVLMLALEEGSLCVEASVESIARRLTDVVGADEARSWALRVLGDLATDCFPRLVGTAPSDHRPVILHTVGDRRFLYFQKYLKAELEFERRFRERLQPVAAPPLSANVAAVLREVMTEQPLLVAGRRLELDRDQQLAVAAALLQNLTIISGGPGTGKTSIVLTLLRGLVRCGFQPERIALAAPTGRAAQRLGDALRSGLSQLLSAQDEGSADHGLAGLNASTLHQLLAYRPTRNLFGRHAENPIPADVVIVDEVSMVGLVLMTQLLQALEPGAKLIMLGDKDQLPSIEAGAVLGSLIADERGAAFSPELTRQLAECLPDIEAPTSATDGPLRDCVVLLHTNHRSQKQIREAAQAINRRDTAVVDRLPVLAFPEGVPPGIWWDRAETAGGCWLLEQVHGTASELRAFLQPWAEEVYFRSTLDGQSLADVVRAAKLADGTDDSGATPDLRRLFALLERFRLLTLVREGAWGSVEINRFLDQLLRPRLDPSARGGLFAGAPVLITRNDPVRQLNNGDVGIALRRRDGTLRVVFARKDGFVYFAEEALPAHEPGFALTIHKSQGSEYGHVLVVLPPEGGRRLLTKELVYTAITRAKTLAVLCGTRDVLRLAIGRQVVREAGILQSLR